MIAICSILHIFFLISPCKKILMQTLKTAADYYLQGNAWRKKGDFKRAMDCYMEAIALDPDSPAATAKEMLDDIMAFYCKDCYNP